MISRNRNTGLICLLLMIFATFAHATENEPQAPIEQLTGDFIEAFNTADADEMAMFYQQSASDSFNDRRSEQEDRALHQQLLGMLGKLTIQDLDIQDSDNAVLTVSTSKSDSTNQIRFKLVGKPPKIDGFSIGVPPTEEEKELYSDADDAGHDKSGDSTNDGPFAFLTSAKKVYQSQLLTQSDGSLLLVWVQRGLYQLDLFVARQEQDGKFSQPLRINHHGLNRYTGDEARPDVALSKDGAVAIVWTAASHDIMIAMGTNFGKTFDAPLKLNQDDKAAVRTMPSVSFSPDGASHAVWLDPRQAPKGMEEPSDLYYATVKNGNVTESNLTANQEQTVCGCCRPNISIDEEDQFNIVFRNADLNGYRDISRISGTSDSLGEPQATSPPIWKLNACPSAGPIASQGGTLWKDASTGDWRMLWSTDANKAPTEVFKNQPDLELARSPRTVSGRKNWILVGANDHSLIATLIDESWQIVLDDLPPWVSSAAIRGDELFLLGNRKGKLLASVRTL